MVGYEGHREPFEVQCQSDALAFASVTVCKGLGRCSMILFAVVFSYLKLRDAGMTDEITADFTRPWVGAYASPLQEQKQQHLKGDGSTGTVAFEAMFWATLLLPIAFGRCMRLENSIIPKDFGQLVHRKILQSLGSGSGEPPQR